MPLSHVSLQADTSWSLTLTVTVHLLVHANPTEEASFFFANAFAKNFFMSKKILRNFYWSQQPIQNTTKPTQQNRTFIACKKAPSDHPKWPPPSPETGKSEPNRSIMSVCSLRLMRTTLWPVRAPSAVTIDVLPTPGLPYRNRRGKMRS